MLMASPSEKSKDAPAARTTWRSVLTSCISMRPSFGIVERAVAEAREVEVSADLAVDADQKVQIESRGDSLRVVVGGVEDAPVLFQIDADEKAAPRAARGRRPP